MRITILWILLRNILGNVPYHLEKYIPTEKELIKFKKENEGNPRFSKGSFFYRLVPFTR
jgi:hypothetical protein